MTLKKFIWLFVLTLLSLALIIMPGFMSDNDPLLTELYPVSQKNMQRTVSASGRLRYRSGRPVRTDFAGILDRLEVKNGDEISEGDLLFSYYKVDDAYSAMLSQYGGTQGLEALLGTLSGGIDKQGLISEAKKYCTLENVCSPCSGTVTDISCSDGDILDKDSMVLRISDGCTMEIPVNINETYIEQISVGQKAEITFSALPGKTFSGEVSAVSDEAEQTSGISGKETTVEVTVTLSDAENSTLRVGYSASCTIVTSVDKDVLFLPYEYLRSDDGGDFVFIEKGGRAKKVSIKTGREYKDGTEIISGLEAGDRVIIGTDNIYEGRKVIKDDSGDSNA